MDFKEWSITQAASASYRAHERETAKDLKAKRKQRAKDGRAMALAQEEYDLARGRGKVDNSTKGKALRGTLDLTQSAAGDKVKMQARIADNSFMRERDKKKYHPDDAGNEEDTTAGWLSKGAIR
jgi:hypothetical protein